MRNIYNLEEKEKKIKSGLNGELTDIKNMFSELLVDLKIKKVKD